MLDWKQFEVGNEDAIDDRENLPHAFIKTEHFNKAKTENIRLIVGRKGTGKTALFQEMEDYYSIKPNHKVITIGEEAIAEIRDSVNDQVETTKDLNTDALFENNWEKLILHQCINELMANVDTKDLESREMIFLRHQQTPFSVDQTSNAVFRKAICAVLKQLSVTIIILIDDIDRGVRTGGQQQTTISSMCAGLYLTLNRYRKNIDLQIKAFMPADLYESLGMKDADKFEPDHKLDLRWQQADLLAMIEKRIALSFGRNRYRPMELWNELFPRLLNSYFFGFTAPEKYSTRDRSSWDVILEHTFWRPRDLITLCRKIKEKVGSDEINQRIIEDAIADLSADAFRFFVNETNYRIEIGESVLNQFRNMSQTMNYVDFRARIASQGPGKGLLPEKIDQLIKSLYIFGFYGIGERKIISSSDDRNTTNFEVKFYHETSIGQIGSPVRGVVVIHPIFNKFLTLSPGKERITT